MTVYSKAISGNEFGGMGFGRSRARVSRNQAAFDFDKVQHVSAAVTPVFKLNVFLLITASSMLLSYIFLSNFVTSQKYALNMKKAEFNQLSAVTASDNKNISDKQDLNSLMTFAQKAGMVEAKDSGKIMLEDGNFALSR
jgi:hypothetical protein